MNKSDSMYQHRKSDCLQLSFPEGFQQLAALFYKSGAVYMNFPDRPGTALFCCLALPLLSLLGCSGSGDGGTSGLTVKDVSGIWDVSHEIDGVTDQFTLAIEESGAVRLFDYQADSHGSGDSCYETYPSEPGQTLTAKGSDQFEITMDVENISLPQTLTMALSENNNSLTVKSADTFDED